MKISRLAAALSGIGFCVATFGAEAPTDATQPTTVEKKVTQPAKTEKIEVTGSNIKRVKIETASPVQVITREEMQRGGATSLTEVLRRISSNVGGQDENRAGGFSAGASSLNLRGIGSQATLMLVNGRRLAAYAQPEFQTTFVDLNSIPMGAVERIEILKDGASAIYGSEAMAGVVNIIMKNTYQGFEGGASYGKAAAGDGERIRATATYGFGSLVEDHFNAYASLDVRNTKPMFVRNRDEYIGTQDTRAWGYKDQRSLYAFPGNIYWTDKATGKFKAKFLGADSDCPAGNLVPASESSLGAGSLGTVCLFDDNKDGTFNSGVKSDRSSIISRLTWQPTAETTVWVEGMFNRNKATVTGDLHWIAMQNGQPTGPLSINHPQYPQELITIDPVTGQKKTLAGGNGTVRLRAQLRDIAGQGQANVTDFARVLLGAKGSIGSWDWETALLHNTSKVKSHNTSGLLADQFIDAVKTGKWVFGGPGNGDFAQTIMTTSDSTFKSGLDMLDGKITGELFDLPAGAVSMAVGAEARRETLETNPDPQKVEGNIWHQSQANPGIKNDRRVNSLYSELTVPVLKNLEAQLAARYDHYSDFGNSTTPKIGLKWTVAPSLVLRGTYSEGFRAPTLVENSDDVRNAFLSYRDPARCNANFTDGCNWNSAYQSGSNPDLKPETSKGYTLGVVWEPTSWLTATADLWRIKRTNEISTYNLDAVLANEGNYANNPAVSIVRDPLTPADAAAGATAGEITLVKMLLTNVAITEVKGVDVELRGKFNLGEYGRFYPSLNVQYTKSYRTAPAPDVAPIEYVGTMGTPRMQANLGLEWTKAAWTLSADVTHVGKMATEYDYTQPCTFAIEGYENLCHGISSFTTVDLGVQYTGFKNLTLKATAQNAFNRLPPFFAYDSGRNYYSPLHSAMGRYIQVSASYSFK